MNQKKYQLLGIFALIGIIIISGCVNQSQTPSTGIPSCDSAKTQQDKDNCFLGLSTMQYLKLRQEGGIFSNGTNLGFDTCKKISDKNKTIDCENTFFANFAVLRIPITKELIGTLSAMNKSDLSDSCNSIGDNCYWFIADITAIENEQNALEICSKLIKDYNIDLCKRRVAEIVSFKNIDSGLDSCYNSFPNNTNSKAQCVMEIADSVAYYNPDKAIELIDGTQTYFRNQYFYADIATYIAKIDLNKALFLCKNKINETYQQTNCYDNVAVSISNNDTAQAKNICGMISDKTREGSCLDKVSYKINYSGY
jgi:hypothetical protein